MSGTAQRLRRVLSDQRFPAPRWELICAAEDYGADARSRQELQALPAREYASFVDVVSTVERLRDRALVG